MNILNSVWNVWLIKQILFIGLVHGDQGTFSRNSDDEFQMLVSGGYIPDNGKFASNLVSIRTANYQKFRGDNHFCTGVIISSRTILTAAHCVTDRHKSIMNPRGISIVFGQIYRLADYNKDDCRKTDRIVIHPRYERYKKYDVAVLRLVLLIPGNFRVSKPIAKRKHVDLFDGMKCITLGWGQLYPHGPYANQMMFLDVYVRPTNFCSNMENFVADGNICVEPDSKGQVCAGDLGGPLLCHEYLAGIIGGSLSPCEGIKTMKFINYTHIEDWIDKTVEFLSGSNNNWLSPLLFLLLLLAVVQL